VWRTSSEGPFDGFEPDVGDAGHVDGAEGAADEGREDHQRADQPRGRPVQRQDGENGGLECAADGGDQ